MEEATLNSNRTVLWDMDGTIVDSARSHKLSWQETFRKRGFEFTEEDFKYAFGRRNDEIIHKFMGSKIAQGEMDAIADEKETIFRRLIKDHIIQLPGVITLIKSLKEAGFKQALVSSTPRENIELITNTLGIKSCFKIIISGGDVTKGKPNPQGFLLAAEKLNVAPGNCVVMEDAVAGVTAAKRGGMRCIAVTNTRLKERLSRADIVVDSLEKIAVSDIEKLLRK